MLLQIRQFIAKNRNQLPWRSLWHFTLFIGIFILTRFIFLDLFEKGKYPMIVDIQNALVNFEAKMIYTVMKIFKFVNTVSDATITFSNSKTFQVMWGCSGLRPFAQVFIIFLFLPGRWKIKLWFIPSALGVTCFLVAIHLLSLSFIFALKPDFFDFAHKYLTKIVVFGGMFFMWVYWEHLNSRVSGITIPDSNK